MTLAARIRDLVEQTPLVDTHEHLLEERVRTEGRHHPGLFPCDDWAYLLLHYFGDDLASAGMPSAEWRRLFAPDTPQEEKYRLVAPWWERAKHTGYGQVVRHTLRGLYAIDDLTAESVPLLAERYRALVRPGFYREVLRDRSNIETCQVNSLERIFMETEQPDLLHQDLSIVALSSGVDPGAVRAETGHTADTLEGWLEVIGTYFRTYGPKAVAVKSQSAYGRRLNYEDVPQEVAAPLFARLAREEPLETEERRSLENFLFRHCVRKATEYRLPVKLHTGFYAGHGYMPLERVGRNAADLCPLLQDFPDATFVLMHIGYPYQDEFIALAKHYPNACIDMCWAWIINPAAGVRFLKEFLLAAPANKVFTFGGDYFPVENVYGHSRVARQGIAQAITELVEEGWVPEEEAPALIARLMHGNAHERFPYAARCLAAEPVAASH